MKYSGDSTKLEGTNNYAQNKNFQKLPKVAEMEGTKIRRETKLPKISTTLPSWRGQ
jgi:hypothetical protein